MSGLNGKTAVITGGTGALGATVTQALLDAGVTCHVTTHRDGVLAAPSETPPRRPLLHRVDITSAQAVAGFYQSLAAGGQLVDFLLNLAGGFEQGPVDATSPETWRRLMDLNATSVFLNCREASRLMKARRQGRIVNVASRAALEAPANLSAYVASKAAVVALTQSLARELKDDGITVNVICPSIIDTPANRQAMPRADFSRWTRPRQIADVIAFLLSDAAGAVTGSVLVV